jgi:hypothetical protein
VRENRFFHARREGIGPEVESGSVRLAQGRWQVRIAAHRAKLCLFRIGLVAVIAGPHRFFLFIKDVLWDPIFGTFQRWFRQWIHGGYSFQRVGFDRILKIWVDIVPLAQVQRSIYVQREAVALWAKLCPWLLRVLGRKH